MFEGGHAVMHELVGCVVRECGWAAVFSGGLSGAGVSSMSRHIASMGDWFTVT
jgi:hypothetical protein